MKFLFYSLFLFIVFFSSGNYALAQGTSSANALRRVVYASPGKVQYGTASYYHDKFSGRKTSTGEIFSQKKMTAAHNTLPLGTWIKVTNLKNQKSVVVRINDRLHHRNKRLVDLSKAAAAQLGYIGAGLAKVKVEVLGKNLPELAVK
jgi:rare lipoprotein A